LFNELSHSEVYENIIKAFNEIIQDKGMFFETIRWYSLGGKHLPKQQKKNEEEKKRRK
jgi:predicted aminopeptidase